MSDSPINVATDRTDFFDHEPSKAEKIEMRRSQKTPSEWLRLLCKDWAHENESLVENTDARFIDYKPYTQGLLSPQLLCRLSIPPKDSDPSSSHGLDFWAILGIEDEFDKSYIVAQVERFNALYNIRNPQLDEQDSFLHSDFSNADPTAIAAAAANLGSPGFALPSFLSEGVAAATNALSRTSARTDHDRDSDNEKGTPKKENKKLTKERKEQRAKDREAAQQRKAEEKAQKEAEKEARKRKRDEMRIEREQFSKQQKEAALRRAADLVRSNRVPIEITRGAAAAKAAVITTLPTDDTLNSEDEMDFKKKKSAVIVSTAGDLNAIVTHAKNLWSKYNAIAREHGQKVSWSTVSNELGIHTKVREKYFRMHARAEQRGFDWVGNKDFRIKDHPEIFQEPTNAEKKAQMPPPPPPLSKTVLIENNREVGDFTSASEVVDNSIPSEPTHNSGGSPSHSVELVADPTAGLNPEEFTTI